MTAQGGRGVTSEAPPPHMVRRVPSTEGNGAQQGTILAQPHSQPLSGAEERGISERRPVEGDPPGVSGVSGDSSRNS